jgi:hypothetical protein
MVIYNIIEVSHRRRNVLHNQNRVCSSYQRGVIRRQKTLEDVKFVKESDKVCYTMREHHYFMRIKFFFMRIKFYFHAHQILL